MVGERSGFGNLFKPPPDCTMVDDLSDLSKNKLTVAERAEIVRKIGKDLGFSQPSAWSGLGIDGSISSCEYGYGTVYTYTYYDEDGERVTKGLSNSDLEELERKTQKYLDSLANRGEVIFSNPPMTVNVRDAVTEISITVSSVYSIERFYDKSKDLMFQSTRFNESRDIDYSITVPAVSDDYYEQVIRLMMKESRNVYDEIHDLLNKYLIFVEE